MKKAFLPYEQTGYFSKVIIDYLKGAAELESFYNLPPQISSIPEIIEQKKSDPPDREVVCSALLKQHAKLFSEKNLPAVLSNIESLRFPHAFTVTTAHQPSLFLGPLYVIYKTVSVIVMAEKLNAEYPQHHFVPVFWMGSEDHDKEELNNIHLFGKNFVWNTAQQGAFGRMSPSSLRPWVNEIKEKLGDSPAAKELSEALDDAYVREKTIGAATRKFLYHFFEEDGLVIVDGDDPELKKLFIPVLEKEIREQFSFHSLTRSNEKFAIHYEPQITPREINLFYLDEGIRERIVKDGNQFMVLNTSVSFSQEEIEKLIHSSPEKFSPNVALRPVYQETVLPDVVVVGGGAEVTYWLQLKIMFDELKKPLPIVMLRNSVLWIDQAYSMRMEKLNIKPEELFHSTHDLINHFIEKETGNQFSLKEEIRRVVSAFDDAVQRTMLIDQSLKGSFESEKIRVVKTLEQLEDRLLKAAKRKDETSVNQIRIMREKLFPENKLQERYDNFMMLYSKHGKNFIDELKLNLDPFEQKFTALIED